MALRNALVHLPEEHETRRALYLAIAEAISVILAAPTRADQERTLSTERAFALYHAREFAAAGQAFEALDRLDEAERAYTAGGHIEELEYLHLKRDMAQSQLADRQAFEQTLDEAFLSGRRKLVLSQIRATQRDTQIQERYPELITRLSQRQRQLEARCFKHPRVQLRWQQSGAPPLDLHLYFAPSIRIGRSPTVEFQLPAPSLSREHLEISALPEAAGFMLRDLHTRSGSFLDGDGIDPDPGAKIPSDSRLSHEIGLGLDHQIHAQLWSYPESPALALYAETNPHRVYLLCPQGAPLFLSHLQSIQNAGANPADIHGSAPSNPNKADKNPASPALVLKFDREFGLLRAQLFSPPSTALVTPSAGQEPTSYKLNGHRLIIPAQGDSTLSIELLLHDQLQGPDRAKPWTLEVQR